VVRALAVGLVAGAVSGLFGVGGGVVIVPLLVALAGYDQRTAHGTSLTAIGLIALSGATGYGLAGEVDWAVAALMALGSLVGTLAGTRLLAVVPQRHLQVAFAVVLVVTALRMVLGDVDAGTGIDLDGPAAVGMVALGAGVGLLAGLLGVGGGVLAVPVLTLVAGLPLVLAKGTSLAVIVPTAAFGTVRNRRHGTTRLREGLLVGAGGVLSAFAASRVALGLDARLSAVLFAALLVVTAVQLLRRR
jgi:uncharacterized membrane protein YfcA